MEGGTATHWLDYVTAIGSIATPFLVAGLTAVGLGFRKRIERRIDLEDQLRGDRIEIYNKILEPFIILLTAEAAWQTDPKNKSRDKNAVALKIMLSLEYRKLAFQLSLIGSDRVVMSYNDMMQFIYEQEDQISDSENPKKLMAFLGTFLLEIRRSMGNESTALTNWNMLEWFLKDAREFAA